MLYAKQNCNTLLEAWKLECWKWSSLIVWCRAMLIRECFSTRAMQESSGSCTLVQQSERSWLKMSEGISLTVVATEWSRRVLAELLMSWKGCKFKLPRELCQLLLYVYCMMSLLIISLCSRIANHTKCVSHVKVMLDSWHTDHFGIWVCVSNPPSRKKIAISENGAEIGRKGDWSWHPIDCNLFYLKSDSFRYQ